MVSMLSPFTIQGITIKNRIVMPPMANNLAGDQGEVNDRLIEHYQIRAAQQVGLVIVEHAYIVPDGKVSAGQLAVDRDALIPGLKALVDAVHQAGARIGVQLNHAGSRGRADIAGATPVGPAAVVHPRGGEEPRELLAEELPGLARAYAQAAVRAQMAGFDMVEIHGAHGYLLNQFFSPLTNLRRDAYGGTREARIRFPLEVVAAVRAAVGPGYPVFYRLGADDRWPGGLSVADGAWAAAGLVAAGVDVLDLSGGVGGYRVEGGGQGYFRYMAEAVKAVTHAPVILTGGITEPVAADGLVRQGVTDLVGVGRALLKDPAWAAKAIKVLETIP